jgi:O-antigen/teichoic acid export membrane protein
MNEYYRSRVALNVISSAIQVIIVGLSYFFVYKILINRLGVDLLGVWSLIIATTSISNLANFGFTSALVKFVAEYNANNNHREINKLLFTSFFSMLVMFTLVTLIVYILAYFFIERLVGTSYIGVALNILPLSLFSLFINALSSVLTSALEGFQRNYLRNLIYSVTVICYLLLTVALIPFYGLVGLAYAQVIQSLLIFILAYLYLKKLIQSFSLIKWNWDKEVFKRLFSYGYRIQMISIFQMLIDPVTKILISKFNGITTLGFYEMASRLIIQLRQIIVSMTQVTIPIVSHFNQTNKSAIKYVYERGISFVVFLVFPLVAGIFLFIPYLSGIWIGQAEPVFINCVYILALSMLVNILCAPAYFNSFGDGNLNGVLYMNIFIMVIMLVLSIVLGKVIPVYGIVISWGISFLAGSLFLIYHYQKRTGYNFFDALKSADYILIVSALIFIVVSRFFFLNVAEEMKFSLNSFFLFFLVYTLFFVLVTFFNRNFKLLNILQFLRGDSHN